MCGIVGYIGTTEACPFLVEGLRRLEYRGYDSAGLATITPRGQLAITKTVGRIDDLAEELQHSPAEGATGIGHTRWATHGPPTRDNAHPHLSDDATIAIVHNGVIENFRLLKERLVAEGCEFRSATDTEVIAQLVAREVEQLSASADLADPYGALADAVQRALAHLRGTYGLAIVFRDWPDVIIAARLGSPLVIGVGDGEHFVASDGSPLVGHTDKIVYLADHEMAIVTADTLRVVHRDQGHIRHSVEQLEIETADVGLGGFSHYMLKEIFEQPEALEAAMRGRLNRDEATAVFGGLNLTSRQLRAVDRIVLTACGTSWHAALVGEYMLETFSRIPVEVEYASELRYRNPPLTSNTLLFALTQSGETADTLAALREVKRKGHPTLAICNAVGSTIAQTADGGIYLHSGPEIGVASTKAYSAQCVVLAMLALFFGRLRDLSFESGLRLIDGLEVLPKAVEAALASSNEARRIAEKYLDCENFLYLGRLYNFPTALEGALKLKEISYIHAEGLPAAEMKHGPIALIDDGMPVVVVAPHDHTYDKVLANIEEVKGRKGSIIAIATEGDEILAELADAVIYVPKTNPLLSPLVTTIPLQLMAYYAAVARGHNVDRPRNLAKSVTVE